MKRNFSTEAAYVLGVLFLALGTAMMEKAGFGLSTVVAPAYLVHLKVSEIFPGFTFGLSEYCVQALLLIVLACIMGRFKLSYLFSFGTALFYGAALDGCIALCSLVPGDSFPIRLIWYVVGMCVCSASVAMIFEGYVTPQAYELFVKELTAKLGAPLAKVKTAYDIAGCVLSIALSILFFGPWPLQGINWGTVVCACLNGMLIALFGKLYHRTFQFRDVWGWRKFFS